MNSQNQRAYARYLFATLLGALGVSALMVAALALAAPAVLSNAAFPWLFFASSMLGGLPVFLAARRRQEQKQKPVRAHRNETNRRHVPRTDF